MMSLIFLAWAMVAAPPEPPVERRCGWLHNPTPANWWLTDRDGQWVMGVQGGYRAPGMDDMPDMSRAGWVRTNGNYGRGCACIRMQADRKSGRVLRIHQAVPLPLQRCNADRRLPAPE